VVAAAVLGLVGGVVSVAVVRLVRPGVDEA